MARDDANLPRRCPSAQPGMDDAHVLGVMEERNGSRQVTYIDEAIPVTEELLARMHGVEPTEIIRISARCDEKRCAHFDGTRCQLATRVVNSLPVVVDLLPACTIRSTCRWYVQEGPPACQRCPQIATLDANSDEEFAKMAYGSEGLVQQAGE